MRKPVSGGSDTLAGYAARIALDNNSNDAPALGAGAGGQT